MELQETNLEQEDIVLDGVCAKQVLLRKNMVASKHIHDYDHISILASGKVGVFVDDEEEQIVEAPAILKIEAGKEHSVFALEDSVWFCIHRGENSDALEGGV